MKGREAYGYGPGRVYRPRARRRRLPQAYRPERFYPGDRREGLGMAFVVILMLLSMMRCGVV